MTVLQIDNLGFSYGQRTVLRLDTLTLNEGDTCAVIGPSGCGKTTLLHLIAGLLQPAQGSVAVCGQRLDALDASARDRFRGHHLGIVFQRLHLLPALDVLENLLLAQRLARVSPDAKDARRLLDALGVGEFARARPAQLSQGQAQRVAIARALVHRPALLLADEPTSSLDDDNAERAIDLLQDQARAVGAALLVVTHDRRIRGWLAREVQLEPPA
ncbi:ABC transporter ATP-binding protein [Sinimarinibacterium flocculans]|uniref:Putative ABC transport system ATP-binding protein n=1 Tax=Sinimarinibacterium flocculans TaxID=985250 RepID=A0A318E350_9GAMM|nr:ABC transporter ATP-binding protein [Sinimarinibacterium flocculans]PXV65327.1 putative ABC transport system ATP-binding protein [Sinimarinibacterium flocculans]